MLETFICNEFEEDTESFGIGVEFSHNGHPCRVGVSIPENANSQTFKKAWKKLVWAYENPDHPDAKTKYGNEQLSGLEISVED